MYWLHMGPFPTYVGFTTSEKAWNREMRRMGCDEQWNTSGGNARTTEFVSSNGGHTCIITLHTVPSDILSHQVAGLIAHEALHVVQYMRGELNNGRPFDNETESYLIQYITQSCLKHVT